MAKRRVGTISMAIVLISFGILIFISQINKASALQLAAKFWPAILFLIGGEILYYSYKYKDEGVNIKYDVLSILVVLLIVGVNLIIYSVIEVGLMDRIYAAASSQTFNYQMPFKEVEIGEGIKKIVINPGIKSSLTIRTGREDKIIATGSLNITTDSEESAKEFLDEDYIRVEEIGDIAYVSFAGRSSYNYGIYGVNPHSFELILPADKEVEISKAYEVEVILDDIGNNWLIDGVNHTKIRLGKNPNLKINALVGSEDNLAGSVKWNITKESKENATNVKGQVIYGTGEKTINILNSYQVVVDELE